MILLQASSAPDTIVDGLVNHGTRIAIVIVLGLLLHIAATRIVPAALQRAVVNSRQRPLRPEELQRTSTLSQIFVHVISVVIIAMGSFMILGELGLNITPVLAGAGVIGIAIGFGTQNLFKDMLAGFFIVVEDQFTIGDVVCAGGVCGLVEDFSLRRTVLRDLDGYVHYVPNGEVRVTTNLSKDYARVNLDVTVAYDVDINRAVESINRVGRDLATDAQFAADIREAPQVFRIENLGDSGVVIKVLGVTERLRHWDITSELRKRIKQGFDNEGIEIPFPHTAVVWKNRPNSDSLLKN